MTDRKKPTKLVIRARNAGAADPKATKASAGRKALADRRGKTGSRGPTGFGGPGPAGPQGPPGEAPEPVSVSLTRDLEDRVETVTPEGEPTLTIARNADGTVTGLSSSEKVFTVNRDSEGRVTGVTVADA